MDVQLTILVIIFAAGASILGSMLGLGGGVLIVPLFTLYLSIDPKIAVGASAIAVVTNSVVGTSQHLKNGLVNVRLASLLEVTTAMGAIVGAAIAVAINADFLKALLGIVLIYAAVSMLRGRKAEFPNVDPETPDPLGIMWEYYDPAKKQTVRYLPRALKTGVAVSTLAGVLSGLLGIGGGVVKGPIMNLVMRMPVKAAAGTSSFMIGMTAMATAMVFYSSGKIDPQVAVPAMAGVYMGSNLGSTITRHIRTDRLVLIFFAILAYLGLSMILSAFNISLF